jgi:S1-C subfamily serine protease
MAGWTSGIGPVPWHVIPGMQEVLVSLLGRRRRPAVILALTVLLTAPVLAAAGPAQAAPPAGGRVQPAALPANPTLGLLGDLLARLLPGFGSAGPGLPATTTAQAAASTVRVNGVACGVHLAGSGFSPAADVIVTNAHVVAGTSSTSVLRPDGRTLPAQVQVFDPARDFAVLAVPGLNEPALGLASAVPGESDAVFGHPFGQAPVALSPAVVLRRVNIDLGDIYDRPAAPRQILVLASQLDPGDSGGALVNGAGKVVGVAFATSSIRRGTAFAVASEELGPVLAQPRTGAVSTGPCIE